MRRYLSVTIPLVLLAGSSALAQSPFPYYAPKLRNSKDGEVQDFPLGVLSATGRLQHGATAITVMDVGPDGPGQRAGLRVGDAIVAIEGKAMPPYSSDLDAELMGPQTALATALDEACSRPHPQVENDRRAQWPTSTPGGRSARFAAICPDVPSAMSKSGCLPPRCLSMADRSPTFRRNLAGTYRRGESPFEPAFVVCLRRKGWGQL